MRYCLFCKEAFEDDPQVCPYCGDPVVDSLPDPDADDEENDLDFGASEDADMGEGPAAGDEEGEEFEGESPLVQVAIVESEEHLRAAVESLKKQDVYFELEEVDKAKVLAALVGRRAWRILVPADEAEKAFLRLVEEVPGIFPHEVREAVARAREPEEEEDNAAAEHLLELLEPNAPPVSGVDLAKAIVAAFATGRGEAVGHAKYALALRGVEVAPLLSGIAAEAIAEGGEGAETVLYNAVDILDAIEYESALDAIEPLYASEIPQVRARAAYAAGRLGSPSGIDALLDLLEDPDEEVRYEASEAIWRLSGLDFDFDPYAPIEKEIGHIEHLRSEWEKHRGHDHVRNRHSVADLLVPDGDRKRALPGDEGEPNQPPT